MIMDNINNLLFNIIFYTQWDVCLNVYGDLKSLYIHAAFFSKHLIIIFFVIFHSY